jgi:hypothetical protein
MVDHLGQSLLTDHFLLSSISAISRSKSGYRAKKGEPIERFYGYDSPYRLGGLCPADGDDTPVAAICEIIHQPSSFYA